MEVEYGGGIRVVLGITSFESDISDWVRVAKGGRGEVGEGIGVVLEEEMEGRMVEIEIGMKDELRVKLGGRMEGVGKGEEKGLLGSPVVKDEGVGCMGGERGGKIEGGSSLDELPLSEY